MGNIVDALKDLAVAIGCATDKKAITGTTVAEVIKFISNNWPKV